jgi:hypothetical protein
MELHFRLNNTTRKNRLFLKDLSSFWQVTSFFLSSLDIVGEKFSLAFQNWPLDGAAN